MKATITSKGQITIPIKLRRRLNLAAGDTLDFDESAPFLVARCTFPEAEMRGVLVLERGLVVFTGPTGGRASLYRRPARRRGVTSEGLEGRPEREGWPEREG